MADRMPEAVHNYFAPDPSTWFDRLRRRLFPAMHCFAPDAPPHYKDCVNVHCVTYFTFVDRLRVLFSGRVETHARIVTEHTVGATVSASVCYPLPPAFMERVTDGT